ncbi:hypothetical protein CFC21_040370 [Triticum aestivum]|uniref:Uncharacterized protein n=2 Tax=Triticum aestivum TaxID=4565 RepID=A0A3B6FIJ5_WHEAT|nr:hypothetical protein CFC21_040370 [Triticum aestivum]
MMSGRLFGTGAEYGGFALFLVELLGLLGVLIAPYYTVFHDLCSMRYLVTVHIPESLDVPSRFSVTRYDFVSALQGASRDAALHLFHAYHPLLEYVGRGEWPHQLEEAGSSSAPPPTVAPAPFASTSAFPPLPPHPAVLPPTFLPPPATTAARPPLYPTVPPTRADRPAPRIFRGSSSRAVSRPSTPYERPPTPQLVQDLLDRVDTLQRRCSELERANSEMSSTLRDYTRPGMALNPFQIDSSPSASPGRIGYPIDQESLVADEPSSQVAHTLSSVVVPPPPEHTPHTPPGSPLSAPAPPSPDGTPEFSVISVTYSELLALDSRQVSSQPPEYLRVAFDVTPSEHTPSEYPLSTISVPESDAAAPSVSLPAPTSALDPDLLLTVSPSPLVRED